MARSSLQIMRDTVHALIMREINTRFGSSRLGYFWALAEPAAQAGIMAIMFSLIGRSSISGVPVTLFLLVAVLPYKLFSKLTMQLSVSVSANKALLSYRQVGPLDPFLARLMIEIATFVLVYIILISVCAWFGMDVWPQDLLGLIYSILLVVILATGIGLLMCNAMVFWDDIIKVWSMITTPLFIISGIFFTATMIPAQYWYLFTWNPIFHIVELSRDAMFVSYSSPVADANYVLLIGLTLNSFGLMLYQLTKHRFIAS